VAPVADPRLQAYARLLVHDCLDVQPDWQALIYSSPLGRPLVEEVTRELARRGAYALPRLSFGRSEPAWTSRAPLDLLSRLPEIEAYELDQADCLVVIEAPENTRAGSELPPERLALRRAAQRPHMEAFFASTKPWVGCQFPTHALAQDAGMSLPAFSDILYRAVLVDWEALAARMRRIAQRFDGAEEVRIVGAGTDLRFSLAGRHGCVDALGASMPGGEVFYSPVEDSAEGLITFEEYPACYGGRAVEGVRLRFKEGRAVEAEARTDEDFLHATLDADPGARRLGELGIGCNPGIQRHLKNTLFDEKIEGTVRLALGNGFPFLGGRNVSAIHWDLVKDLRRGGRIELDGQVVQESGRWRL
jgi:aminopeptidase